MQHFLPTGLIFDAFMLIFPEVVASFAVATGWGILGLILLVRSVSKLGLQWQMRAVVSISHSAARQPSAVV